MRRTNGVSPPLESGFTLIEVLLAVMLFAITVVGALSVAGATASGSLDTIVTGLVTARTAKDTTVAATYLQAFHEFLATQGGSNFGPADSRTFLKTDPDPFGFPKPSTDLPDQLNWTSLTVEFSTWTWEDNAYVQLDCEPLANSDCVVSVRSTLIWKLRGDPRPPLAMVRFLPR